MSLVVLSNETGQEASRKYSDWQKPYSFTNHMTNTMTIEPNSEVACVSVKCNKDALVTPETTFLVDHLCTLCRSTSTYVSCTVW